MNMETAVERYLRPYVDSGNFSGAVLLAEGETILACAGYGQANYEHGIPCRPRTRFHIASVSKPFTALAVLILERQGRLRRDDLVERYFGELPGGDRVTLDHLLTHTSGIPDINQAPFYADLSRSPQTPVSLAVRIQAWLQEVTQRSEIGTYNYSNTNYNLLAAIVELTAQEEYGEFLRDSIFLPAGMTRTSHDASAADLIPDRAAGYTPAGRDGVQNAPYIVWSNKTGNGSLVSTVEDLHRFHCALSAGMLLPPASLDEAIGHGSGNRYGWFVRNTPRGRSLAANGRSPGFTASLERFAERDRCVIVLSNRYSTVSQSPIAGDLAGILFGEQAQTPETHATVGDAAQWARLAGAYQGSSDFFMPNAVLRVEPECDHLALRWGDQAVPLVPLDDSSFRDRLFWAHVRFEEGANVSPSLIWAYDGHDYRAERIAPP